MVSNSLVQADLGHCGCSHSSVLLQFKIEFWKQISASASLIPENWPQVMACALTGCVPDLFGLN